MIAHLRGKLIFKQPGQAIVEAGGVGYDVAISVPTFTALPSLGAEAALHIHTQVSEDQIALFGFLGSRREAALRAADHGERRGAEAGDQDAERACNRSARCRRSARRIMRSLRAFPVWAKSWPSGWWSNSKTSSTTLRLRLRAATVQGPAVEDVLSALTNLGYQRPAAEKAIEQAVAKDKALAADFDALFRGALKLIR